MRKHSKGYASAFSQPAFRSIEFDCHFSISSIFVSSLHMFELDGLHSKSTNLTVCTIVTSEVLYESCSLFLVSHDSNEERAAVRWPQFCWHRSGKLRSITVRTTARVRPTQFCSHHNGKPRSITIRARAQENCCLSTQSQSSSQRTHTLPPGASSKHSH